MSCIIMQDIPTKIFAWNKVLSLKENTIYEVINLLWTLITKQAEKNSILLSLKSFDFWNNKQDDIYNKL